MTLADQRKLAASIFRLLKVTEISFPIGRTNKGNLEIKFSQNSENFELLLDAVPLPTLSKINDENNITLKGLIEKYWFDGEKVNALAFPTMAAVEKGEISHAQGLARLKPKNKGGRPKGSRNKPKPVEDKVNG